MANHYELIYTSVPRGLRAGSQGFCTVAKSTNMPTGLIGPLENLSAYRHIDAAVMPVNFSHVRMKVAGRNINVISRIGDAGSDYTGRTNKIAHHIVVDAADRPEAGPTTLLMEGGLTRDVWDREPGELPPLASLPQVQSSPRVARQWAAVAGDAGWAGHVASHFVSGGPTMWLIHRPDQNAQLLEMIDESLSILTPSQRWDATFATYCGDVAPGVTVRLRCVLAGSPEAASAAAVGGINLASGSLGSPPESLYVDAARQGVAVESLLTKPVARIPTQKTTFAHSTSTAPSDPNVDDLFALQPPLPPAAGTRPAHFDNAMPPLPAASPQSQSWWIPVTAVVLLLMLVGAGGAVWVINEQRKNDAVTQLTESTPDPVGNSASESSQMQEDSENAPTLADFKDEPPMHMEDLKSPESAVTSPEPQPSSEATKLYESIKQSTESIVEDAKALQVSLGEMQGRSAEIQKQLGALATMHTELAGLDVLRNSGSLEEAFVKPAEEFNKELQEHQKTRQDMLSQKKAWIEKLVELRNIYNEVLKNNISEWQTIASDIQSKVDPDDKMSQWESNIKKIKIGIDSLQSLSVDTETLSKRFIVLEKSDLAKFSIDEELAEFKKERESHVLNVYLYLSGSGNNTKLNVEMRCDLANEELSQCSVAWIDASKIPGPGSLVDEEFRVFPNQQLYVVRDNDFLNLQLKPGGGDLEFSKLVTELVKAARPVISQFGNIKNKIDSLGEVGLPIDSNANATQRAPYNAYVLVRKAREMLPEFSDKQSLECLKKSTDEIIGKVKLEGDDDPKVRKSLSSSDQDLRTRLDEELAAIPMHNSVTDSSKPPIRSVVEQLQRYLENRDGTHVVLEQLLSQKLIDFQKTLVFSRTHVKKDDTMNKITKEIVESFDLVFIPKFHYDPPPG